MKSTPPIRLTRPSFWPEPRAPEAWLRALEQLRPVLGGTPGQSYSPRSLWAAHLRKRLSIRSVPGLFGVEGGRILGVGFLVRDTGGALRLDATAEAVLEPFRRNRSAEALARLAVHLLRFSVPLRLLMIRLARGDWELAAAGAGPAWEIGTRLVMRSQAEPERWCGGIEADCLGGRADRFPDAGTRGIRPDLTARNPSHRFGWGPVEAALYLLDSLGWLGPAGVLRLPAEVGGAGDLIALQPTDPRPAAVLRELIARQADVRGFVAVERVLRSLRETLGDPILEGPDFSRWMDSLCEEAGRSGAVEVEAAEPGQPRHGRGLGGDRRRQLVRWQIHEPFNVLYARLRTPPGNHPDGGPST